MTDDRRTTENGTDGSAPSAGRTTGDEYGVFTVSPDETATGAVVDAVAATGNADPLELEPLYDAIDPDALDALVRPDGDAEPTTATGDVTVAFTYAGYRVAVDATGLICLRRNG